MRSTFEVPELQIYCEVDCIAEPLIELQSRQLWMSRQWNQISLTCVRRQQKLFCFFQLHTPVKPFFNNITTFKTKHGYQLQPEDDIRWCALKTTSPCFVKLVKQTETRFSLKFVNVGDEQKFPKTSVCIILVDLVYLESAKICTGLKIVRGLKRLRTTASDYSLCSRSVKFLKRRCFSNQGSAA